MYICIDVKNQHDQTAAPGGTTNKSYKADKAHMYAKKSALKSDMPIFFMVILRNLLYLIV